MKDLTKISKEEQTDFFNSFDCVLCDVDGVLWRFHETISGSLDAIKSLKNHNKKIIYVSNNSTRTHDDYFQKLKIEGFATDKSSLIQPTLVIIDFLKKRNFSKEIYLIGMTPLKSDLKNAGFKIAEYAPDWVEEDVPKYVKMCVIKNENVGAVVADIDVNMNILKLQRAATFLKNPNVLFLIGGSDKVLHYGPGETIIGPGNFHKILEDITGRKPECLAKPGPYLKQFIEEKYGIKDPSRVLFIGDSIPEDMGFASNCGYKKLLVFSGLTQESVLENWGFPEEFKPNYYINSLQDIHEVLNKM